MRSEFVFTLLISTILAIGLPGYNTAANYYVDKTYGSNFNSGRSWDDAFGTIQRGIDACDTGIENDPDAVHVAAAIYWENINLDSYITLLGGYPPGGGERDWEANETIIDGGDDDVVVNLYRDDGVSIDGFSITNGRSKEGGGLHVDESALHLINCSVHGNTAYDNRSGMGPYQTRAYGGGLYCVNSRLTIVKCRIADNQAFSRSNAIMSSWAYSYGGGAYFKTCRVAVAECLISGNEAWASASYYIYTNAYAYSYGGGIDSVDSTPELIHCTVANNRAYAQIVEYESDSGYSPHIGGGQYGLGAYGGGFYCIGSLTDDLKPSMRNCLIYGNMLKFDGYWDGHEAGGGIFFCATHDCEGSEPVVANTTIADNEYDGVWAQDCSKPTLTDCIIWGNKTYWNNGDVDGIDCSRISYCDIKKGDCEGSNGNTSEDPLFVEEYYLSQTEAGQDSDSPCVDAGSDASSSQGLDDRSTRTDQKPDLDVVDLGWHYPSNKDNHNPLLTEGRVEPDHGRESTTFSYLVHYADWDEDAPSVIEVYIDGDAGHDMALDSGTYYSGTYIYQTQLTKGDHVFHFYCEDGKGGSYRDPRDADHRGPEVDGDISLTEGKVDPESGTTETSFTYSVNYSNAKGYAPSVKNVYIDDDSGHDMTLDSGDPANGTYVFVTMLSYGEHGFYFYFEDGNGGTDRDPASGAHDGPSVDYDPVLSDPTCAPDSGRTDTGFTFTVHYYHAGGKAPTRIQAFVNGTPHDMTLDSGTAADGVYAWTGLIPEGGLAQYHFEAED